MGMMLWLYWGSIARTEARRARAAVQEEASYADDEL
jgi:hypothetical protein